MQTMVYIEDRHIKCDLKDMFSYKVNLVLHVHVCICMLICHDYVQIVLSENESFLKYSCIIGGLVY